MRYSFFTFIISLFAVAVSAQEIRSVWQTSAVTINGYADEWPETFRYYDGNTMLQFAIANDTANVYVCLKANDVHTQRNLLHAGLNVWLDPKGKKKEITGVVFPMRKEMVMPVQQGSTRRGMNEMKQQVLLAQNTVVVYGLNGIGKDVVPIKGNEYGVEVALSWDSLDIMVLEYKIPISAMLGHSLTAADTTKPMSFGLVIAAEKAAPGERRQGDDMDQDPSAGGMANGGLMRNSAVGGDIGRANNDPMNPNLNNMQQSGGSMGFNGPPPNMYVEQDQRVWLKMRLASQ